MNGVTALRRRAPVYLQHREGKTVLAFEQKQKISVGFMKSFMG